MEGQPQIKPHKMERKRLKCDVCDADIIEGFFKMHRARCQFLKTLNTYRTKPMGESKKEQPQKQQKRSPQSDEQQQIVEKTQVQSSESPEDQEWRIQRAYAQLLQTTRQVQAEKQAKKRQLYNFDLYERQSQSCYYCGQVVGRHRLVHQQYCSKRHNFCHFCGEQHTAELMEEHHYHCQERRRISRIEMLMNDSSNQASSSSDQQEGSFIRFRSRPTQRPRRPPGMFVDPREDDIYESNPYVRSQSQYIRDPDLIYTHTPPIEGSPYYSIEVQGAHRPLYRYRRQYFPHRHQGHQQEPIDEQMEKRVIQSLIKYGYDVSTLEKLKGHPKYYHYLKKFDDFINNDEDPFSEGMTQYEISHLQQEKYERKKAEGQQRQQDEDVCPICYSVFEDGEKIMRLKCNHYFHEFCLRQWLQVNFRCPICKSHQVSRKISIQT